MPQEFADFIRKDIEMWTAVLSMAGLKNEHDGDGGVCADMLWAVIPGLFPHGIIEVMLNSGHCPMDETLIHLATRMGSFMAGAR